MKMMKSKTMWFSLALVIAGTLLDLFPTLHETLDPRFYSISLVVIGVLVAVLRFLTTQPLDEK